MSAEQECHSEQGARSDGGFALLIVAVMLAALSLIFAAVLQTTRQEVRAVAGHIAEAKLSAALDGALATVAHALGTASTTPPAFLEHPQTLVIGGITVTVAARPEASKLDLNFAAVDVLQHYFALLGVPGSTRGKLGEDIAVRRRETPKPYETLSELRNVAGMDDDTFDCLSPDLTVISAQAEIEPDKASAPVLEASGEKSGPTQISVIAPAVVAGQAVSAGEILELTLRAKNGDDSQTMSRRTILRVTGDPRRPVWTIAESSPAPDDATREAACARMRGIEMAARGPS